MSGVNNPGQDGSGQHGGAGGTTPFGLGGVNNGNGIGWTPITNSGWGTFMNTYAIYLVGSPTSTYTTTLTFPVDGTYTFNMSVDNDGTFSLDGAPVISLQGGDDSNNYQASPAASKTAIVTAGPHTISLNIVNITGPYGGAVQILDPNNNNFWNTRMVPNSNSSTGAGWGFGGAGADDFTSAPGGNGADGYVKIYWGPNNDPNWVN